MTSIHLVLLDSEHPQSSWPYGRVWNLPATSSALCDLVNKQISNHGDDNWLFWGNQAGLPSAEILEKCLYQAVDIWHAGLMLGMNGLPGLIDFVAPTWMFNRDPDPSIEATSWRVSLQACLVRGEVIRQLGFLNPAFTSLEAAALEWGRRCIQHGALLRHQPSLLPAGFQALPQQGISFADQLRFIQLRYGRKWATWAVLRALLSCYAAPQAAISAWKKLRQEPPPTRTRTYQSPTIQPNANPLADEHKPSVSVLIPTLERYPYLRTLLRQLGEQSRPADEILVIDQTPPEQRETQLYQEFEHLPLRVFYQEKAGQCSSRNLGLSVARGEAILFLDDDDEIPPDLLEKHLLHLAHSAAEASCGAADEVGAGPLPVAFTYRRASNVFPTNNTLLCKSALLKSGLFDLAYEHGARADGDLGMRLYLSGALMVLQPEIRVLHHHAPRGGLRAYKARKTTYASSRSSLLQRNLPGITELYLVQRYFSPRQTREHVWISILGTFSLHQPGIRRWLKGLSGGIMLPHSLWVISRRSQSARSLLKEFPRIPQLNPENDPL